MSWSKIIASATIVLFVLGFVTINIVVAGEKVTWHGTSLMTESKQVEVGDVEGHVMAISKFKQLLINDKTGEKTVSTAVSSMDMNPKMKQFKMTGCGWTVYPNGDKIMRTFDGAPIGEGKWKGTWTFVRGTGKYEGVKGSGTWTSQSMGQGQPSYMEAEGEVEYPQQ